MKIFSQASSMLGMEKRRLISGCDNFSLSIQISSEVYSCCHTLPVVYIYIFTMLGLQHQLCKHPLCYLQRIKWWRPLTEYE